jgi:hypothetical protein
MGKGGGGEDGVPLDGAARAAAAMGGLSWCLDPTTIGPHGGSRAEKGEDSEEEKPRTGLPIGASAVEKD